MIRAAAGAADDPSPPRHFTHEVEIALRRLLLGDELVQRAWPREPLRAP